MAVTPTIPYASVLAHGAKLTSANWNKVVDSIRSLGDPPAGAAEGVAQVAIDDSTTTKVAFGETPDDAWGSRYVSFGVDVDNSIHEVLVSGFYIITGSVAFSANSTGDRMVALWQGSPETEWARVVQPAAATLATGVAFSYGLYLTGGGQFSIRARQNSGGALTLDHTKTRLGIARIGGHLA